MSQGFSWGPKGGFTVGVQRWSTFDRDPLYTYHAGLLMESLNPENKFTFFGALGWHVKGSAIRIRQTTFLDVNGNERTSPGRTTRFEFNNISLALGGKRKYNLGGSYAYYLIGLRGEYTVSTNLAEFNSETNPNLLRFLPIEENVRHFNYGATIGGGWEFPLANLIDGYIEFTINPDFSQQYYRPPIPNVRDPFTGQQRTLPEEKIINTSLELSIGIKFQRRIYYEEDEDLEW